MTIDKMLCQKWYLKLIAGAFFILCGFSSVRYVVMNVSLIDGSVPISTQILRLSGTIAAILYFIRPMLGCSGLVAVCFYALVLSVRVVDSEAVVFYCVVISTILIPVLNSLRRNPS